MLPKINPMSTPSWEKLVAFSKEKRSIENMLKIDSRNDQLRLEHEDFFFDFSKNDISEDIFNALMELAEACELKTAIRAMFTGEPINETEGRAVLHTALRSGERAEVLEELKKVKAFSDALRSGSWVGYSGKAITDVVNIGIGGSDLGPKMVASALKPYQESITPHYISNVDAAQLVETLSELNPETTLFIIASKTFTTLETITNALSARDWFLNNGGTEATISKHFVAVSTNEEAVTAFGISKENMFGFWDWVGGRFSLWSVIGLSVACAIGYEHFESMLKGAKSMDDHFRETPLAKNLPVISAMIGIWYNNFLQYDSMAILPYDHRLRYLPSYLQQVDMESNGKYVNRSGEKVKYQTGPIIWGEPGTNGQHAFYQLIHQGTKIIPCEFIATAKPAHTHADHHEKLLANFFAQSEALLTGKSLQAVEKELGEGSPKVLVNSKVFEGNKPSTSILMKELNPYNLGKLTAYYEHRVFTQGIIWNVFSFDQWGVELGKQLAKPILEEIKANNSGNHDSSTTRLMDTYQRMRS